MSPRPRSIGRYCGGVTATVAAAAFALPTFYISLPNYIGLYAVGAGLVLVASSAGLTSFCQAAFVLIQILLKVATTGTALAASQHGQIIFFGVIAVASPAPFA